jgi:hypothetical protein
VLFALDALGGAGWLRALRLEGYPPRRPQGPTALQQALFPYAERSGGVRPGASSSRSGTIPGLVYGKAVTAAMRGSKGPCLHTKRPEARDEAKASAPRG